MIWLSEGKIIHIPCNINDHQRSASLAFTESIFIAYVEDSDLIEVAKGLKAAIHLRFPRVVETHID